MAFVRTVARSLARSLSATKLGTINALSLSLSFCPFVLSIFYPFPVCPLFATAGTTHEAAPKLEAGRATGPTHSTALTGAEGGGLPTRTTRIYFLSMSRSMGSANKKNIPICKKRRRLGCVNPTSWPPLAAGSEFTQPSFHLFMQFCTL